MARGLVRGMGQQEARDMMGMRHRQVVGVTMEGAVPAMVGTKHRLYHMVCLAW